MRDEGISSQSSWIDRNATIQSCDEWKSSGDCGFVDEEMVQIYLITNGIDGEGDDPHDT